MKRGAVHISISPIMKFIPLIAVFLFSVALCPAENLLPAGDFESASSGPVLLKAAVDVRAIGGWRCFTSDAEERSVLFALVNEGGSNALKMEMVSNPRQETDGRIGFDIEPAMLPVSPGDTLALRFQARRTGEEECAIMVLLAGHRDDGTFVAQKVAFVEPGIGFENFDSMEWTVPAEATRLNVIFNLLRSGAAGNADDDQPVNPCGVIVDNIVLEKTN